MEITYYLGLTFGQKYPPFLFTPNIISLKASIIINLKCFHKKKPLLIRYRFILYLCMETFIMEPKFEVLYMEDVREFLSGLDEKSREKILYNIDKAKFFNDKELFKKLQDEIWEFRTLYNRTYFRLFAFWDKTDKGRTLVITTHGIVKKTDKTPDKEIERAEQLRRLYFKLKK